MENKRLLTTKELNQLDSNIALCPDKMLEAQDKKTLQEVGKFLSRHTVIIGGFAHVQLLPVLPEWLEALKQGRMPE